MHVPYVTVGIGPWDMELGVLSVIVVPLLIIVVLYNVFKD